jgi:hypothetical protein
MKREKATNTMSKQSPGRLTLIDKAIIQYHSVGVDFELLLSQYLIDGVVLSSYDYLLLGRDVDGKYWEVGYAASDCDNPIKLFMDLAPYRLDKVAISRYRDIPNNKEDIFRFYSWDRLYKKVSSYGSNGNTSRIN